MSYVRIAVHAVWGTKNRFPFLTDDLREKVMKHIQDNCKAKGIFLDTINGYTDHLHCLLFMNADTAITKTLQLIKGESSFWINKQKLTKAKFEWADEYFAVSVSESMIPRVRKYIICQANHHRKVTFAQEYEQFMSTFDFGHG